MMHPETFLTSVIMLDVHDFDMAQHIDTFMSYTSSLPVPTALPVDTNTVLAFIDNIVSTGIDDLTEIKMYVIAIHAAHVFHLQGNPSDNPITDAAFPDAFVTLLDTHNIRLQ